MEFLRLMPHGVFLAPHDVLATLRNIMKQHDVDLPKEDWGGLYGFCGGVSDIFWGNFCGGSAVTAVFP